MGIGDPLRESESNILRRMGSGNPFPHQAKDDDNPDREEMRRNRKVNQEMLRRTAAGGQGSVDSMQFATGRPRDPLFYWKQNNLPYDITENRELKRIREYCRLLQMSHPIIGSCIDIYSKYPLLGAELHCKDEQLTEFYTNLFFSPEGLDYDEFLIDLGREYWTVGEAWPFGSFNEALGVWESDELLNPDDVEVQRSPFLKEPRFLIKLPQTIRELIQKRSPAWEYAKLMQAYPELANYVGENDLMPVSNILLRQLKFKADTFNKRGVPLLMRSMRSVMQEEMLNAAMDAIADRLYTPLILAKLGASATDLGTQVPWIPTADDLEDFNVALDMALSGDFRVLTYNFAIEMESVFGRENMPDMSADFERLEDRILQSFGLSRTMLTGASSGETYAADALNRDLVSQLLTTFQRMIINHYRQRALVVAEAQGHYDYDERNGKRYVKMEEILEVDEETGEERIIEQPKLLIPDLKMKTMNMQDQEAERAFLETLKMGGVPISIKTRIASAKLDLDDEIARTQDEQVQLAVAEQETRKAQYLALKAAGLPIAEDLRADFEPKANNAPQAAAEGARTPVMGLDGDVDTPNLNPSQEDLAEDEADGDEQPGGGGSPVDPQGDNVLPFPGSGADDDDDQSTRPPESDEMRGTMPKASVLYRNASQMREIVREHYRAPAKVVSLRTTGSLNDGAPAYEDVDVSGEYPPPGFDSPKHIGMRRYAKVRKDVPMEDWFRPVAEGE